MQKILVLTSTFPRWPGDTEPPFVVDLCKQLRKEFEVYVLAPHSQGASKREVMDGLNVTRFRYFFEAFETLCYQGGMLSRLRAQPLRFLLIPFFIGFQWLAAYRLIKTENISLIHAHWLIPQGLVACLLRATARQPLAILCTSHGGDLFSLKGKILRFIKRKILLNVQAISVVNSVMADEVKAICHPYKPKVSVIPMGVDFQNTFVPSPNPPKPYSLIFVGRLVEKKGVSYLINALPNIVKRFPEVHLAIIGTGPQYPAIKELVDTLGLHSHVDFLGAVTNSELPRYYQQHQIAAFPFVVAENGDREGLPVVVSEAIGCGCCVVTTDLPGMEDVIDGNSDAIIVPQKDSPALTDAIIYLLSNPETVKQLSRTALTNVATKLSWQDIGRRYLNIFNHLAHKS